MQLEYLNYAGALVLFWGLVSVGTPQNPPASPASTPADQAAPPAPAALSTPVMTGTLANLPPAVFDAGTLGQLSVNGIISGLGMWQGNHVPGDSNSQAALSNGQILLQKTDGWFQFY